jgi:cell division protein FtsQ
MSANARPRLLLAAGILCGLALLGVAAAGLFWLLAPARFPVTQVVLKGDLANTTEAELRAALPRASGNFFALDLAQVRASVERLPWVRRVSARRLWPDRLELTVEEHVALARWGTGDEVSALVNTYGERFSAKSKAALPSFVAPAGTSPEVTLRYRRFSEIVAPLGTSVERVVLTQRHAWQLRLANGLHVMLGRDGDQAEARLRRFVEAYAQSVDKGRKHDYIDLRYPNGFALRVPDGNG